MRKYLRKQYKKSWKRGKKRWENKIINPKEPISEQFKLQNEKNKKKSEMEDRDNHRKTKFPQTSKLEEYKEHKWPRHWMKKGTEQDIPNPQA